MTRADIKTITDIVHKTIYGFFDVCGDDEEPPMTDKDKLLLKINKAICNNIKALEKEPCVVNIKKLSDDEIKKFEEAMKKATVQVFPKESCEDEYIKVPKKALKYRTAGMVAYNVEWLKNHFDIERAVICGAQDSCKDWYDVPSDEMTLEQARQAVKDLRKKLTEYIGKSENPHKWIPVDDKLPKNDENVLVCFLQGGMAVAYYHIDDTNYPTQYADLNETGWFNEEGDAFYFEPIAWMPLPKPYKSQESEG